MENWLNMILFPFAWVQVAQFAYYIIVAALAVSSVIQAQKAKKAAQQALDKAKGLLYQFRATTSPRRILYGRRRIGGLEAYVTSAGAKNESLYYVLIWADGPNEAVEKILFDGIEVPLDSSGHAEGKWANLVQVKHRLGGADNFTAITDMGVPLWTSSDMLLGINYSIIKMTYDDNVFPNGVPNISGIIVGRNDIFDERSSAESYSTNPVLCLNHYLTTSRTGPDVDYASRVAIDEFIDAANACDEHVTLSGGGYQLRYTYNDVITFDTDPELIIEGFKTAFSGVVVYTGGKWHYYAGVYITPTFTIEKKHLVGPVMLQTKISKINHINTVKGTYVAECNDWQPTSFPPVTNPAFVTADDGELLENIDYTSKNTVMEARRMAKIELMRQRLSRSVQIQTNIEGMRAQPGLPVMFNFPELQFFNQPMMCLEYGMSIQNNIITINLTLKEYGSAIFDWDPSEDDESNFCNGPLTITLSPPPGFPGSPGGPGLHYGDLLPNVYPPDASIASQCKNKGGTATMIQFEEFIPGTPPDYYRKLTLSGTPYNTFYGGIPGNDCAGVETGSIHTIYSGSCAYDAAGNLISDNEQVVQSTTGCWGTGTTTTHLACGTSTGTVRSTTLLEHENGIGCGLQTTFGPCFGNGLKYGDGSTPNSWYTTLTVKDTEEDAIDRLNASGGGWDVIPYGDMSSCGAAIWNIRTSGATFSVISQRIKTILISSSGFFPGWPYEVEYDILQRDAGSSDPFVKIGVLTVTVRADSSGSGFTETDVPNERGKETKVTGGTLVL